MAVSHGSQGMQKCDRPTDNYLPTSIKYIYMASELTVLKLHRKARDGEDREVKAQVD